jgi:hypothetical protein
MFGLTSLTFSLSSECHYILQVRNKLITVVQNLQLFIHSAKDKEFRNLNRAETPVSALFMFHTLKTTQNNQETK